MGFVIDSPSLAQELADAFDDGNPESAYEVQLFQAPDISFGSST
jgi:hypothetical protein